MSMLAERKQKQKWSLNPRGKEWSQDANKFGQKMLEKMGWQHGKGLGAKEDGITDHVKVSYKNDSKGIGFKEVNDQWTEHETNFSALLESLTGKEASLENKPVVSLEQKSQTSRARVHYHKFTRGKDLSRASEKDLASIFGKKSLKKVNKTEIDVEVSAGKEIENSSGLLVNGGSMKDYFKKKIPNFGRSSGYVVGNNGVLKKGDSESESESRPTFGFGFNSTLNNAATGSENGVSFIKNEENDLEPGFNSSHDESSKKSKPKFVSKIAETEKSKRKTEENEDVILSPKKKTKKEKVKSEEILGVSNPAFNPMSTPIKIKKHLLEPIQEGVTEEAEDTINMSPSFSDEKKARDKQSTSDDIDETIEKNSKKKKKSKKIAVEYTNEFEFSNPNIDEEIDMSNEICNPQLNPYEVTPSKRKKCKKKNKSEVKELDEKVTKKEKKNKKDIEIDNTNFDDTNTSSLNSLDVSKNPYEVSNKIKKKKNKESEIDNPNFDASEETSINVSQIEENPYEVKQKKNKKSKKINRSFDESANYVTDISEIEENPYEIKPKEKKKKKNKFVAIDNPSFVNPDEKPIDTINPYEVKSKKRIKGLEDPGISNPALDLNNTKVEESIIIEDCELMLNVTFTPTVSKEDTSNQSIGTISTVSQMDNSRRRKSVRFSNVTQELIIPNNEELKKMYKKDKKNKKRGLDNLNFNEQMNSLDENVDCISKTIDSYQAEIENDINEEKIKTTTVEDLLVGEVGNPHGENEQLRDGTKLKFKFSRLDGKTPFYELNKIGPRKSYKHLIKGDILLKFKNTNLHNINGYGVKVKK